MSLRPIHSVTLAARGLRRSPGTAGAAVLTLGMGLCGAVVLLGVLDSGLRDLSVPEGHEVVQVQVRDGRARPLAPLAPIRSWTDVPGLEAAGALRTFQATVSVGVVEDWYPADAGGRAEQVLLPLAQVDPGRLYLSVRTAGPAPMRSSGTSGRWWPGWTGSSPWRCPGRWHR